MLKLKLLPHPQSVRLIDMRCMFVITVLEQVEMCHVKVFIQAWRNVRELTSFDCEPVSNRRKRDTLLGGREPVDQSSRELHGAVGFFVNEMTEQSNGMLTLGEHRVVSGTQQVLVAFFSDQGCYCIISLLRSLCLSVCLPHCVLWLNGMR